MYLVHIFMCGHTIVRGITVLVIPELLGHRISPNFISAVTVDPPSKRLVTGSQCSQAAGGWTKKKLDRNLSRESSPGDKRPIPLLVLKGQQ